MQSFEHSLIGTLNWLGEKKNIALQHCVLGIEKEIQQISLQK